MSSPAHPHVVEAALPPELQGKIVNIAIGMAVAVSLAVWDFLSMIPEERKLFNLKDKYLWKRPSTFAFMVLRYAGAVTLIPGLFLTTVQSKHCQAAASLGEVGVVLVTASAGIIFCSRLFAIWNNNRIVVATVGTLYFLMVGSWLAVATQLRATEGPPTAFASNCKLHPVPTWDPLCFAASVAFDTVVLFLTIIKLKGENIKDSKVGYQILRDNIIYFTIVTVTNLVVLVIQTLPGEKYALIKPVTLPYPTLITTAMGTRIFLNLRLYNERKGVIESLPWSSRIETVKGVSVTSHIHSDASFSKSLEDTSKEAGSTHS